MAADPLESHPDDATWELSVADADDDPEHVVKCGRCRLSFVRDPSVDLSDSPRWWLCPPCRARLLGDVSRTNARWDRSPGGQRPGATRRAEGI
jgi:hypothetical protein